MRATNRLQELAEVIATRTQPLGTDFSTECWGAVAKTIAERHGAHPCDYFQFSPEVYEAAIRLNAALPDTQRNRVMLAVTRELATAPLANAGHSSRVTLAL